MPTGGINVGGSDIQLDFQGYLRAEFLETPAPFLVHSIAAVREMVPANSGQKINFNRPQRMAVATTTLTEGLNPTGAAIGSDIITFTMTELGNFFAVSSKVLRHSPWEVTRSHVPLLSRNWAESIDKIVQQALVGNTNRFYANNVASSALVATKVAGADLARIETALVNSMAQKLTEYLPPNGNIGTTPVDPGFISICHPDVGNDLQNNLTNFIRVRAYPNHANLLPSEIGSFNGIRFCQGQQADDGTATNGAGSPAAGFKTNNAGANYRVYQVPVLGYQSYAMIDFSAVETIAKLGYNAAGVQADALNRASTFGWTQDFVAGILKQDWMALYFVGASS